MKIQSLKLTNFRSWQDYHLDFADITILIGPNGAGKTNILESIWFLASGRSWRTSHDPEVISWDADFAKILANITSEKDLQVELFMQKETTAAGFGVGGASGAKTFKINGVRHRTIELLGIMPAVLFSPETINIISGAPALRRKFLDIMLSQINRNYALGLLEYNKVLRERNHLLENIKYKKSRHDELDFWDEKLSTNGLLILEARHKAIKFFNLNFSQAHKDISGKSGEVKINYHDTIARENFSEHLAATREREIEQGVTLYGPHRDDWTIFLDGKDLSTFGSRGEYRSALLALKILELKYLEQAKSSQPILLLDDIFSELDKERRHHLANIVRASQTIITTTDLDHIDKKLQEKAKIVKIKF
jgi:DNA replication and repair protein RecF